MFGPREIVVVLIVLVIVVMVFGPKRIKSLGSELGNAIKGFRQAVRDKDAETAAAAVAQRDAANVAQRDDGGTASAEPKADPAGQAGPSR